MIKINLELLLVKTKDVKGQIDKFNEDDESIDWQKQNLSVEHTCKNVEQCKSDFDQLKKGKLSNQVSCRVHMTHLL